SAALAGCITATLFFMWVSWVELPAVVVLTTHPLEPLVLCDCSDLDRTSHCSGTGGHAETLPVDSEFNEELSDVYCVLYRLRRCHYEALIFIWNDPHRICNLRFWHPEFVHQNKAEILRISEEQPPGWLGLPPPCYSAYRFIPNELRRIAITSLDDNLVLFRHC